MKKDFKYQLLMIAAMSIWGGSWVCAKVISHSLHFQKLVLVRFVLTFLFLIPPIFIFKENVRIGGMALLKIITGSLFYTLYSQMFFLGLSRGMAGIGGILVTSLVPVITFAAMSVFYHTRIKLIEAAGLVAGLIGSLVILQVWSIDTEALLTSGNAFFLIGAVLWSGVTINSQKTQATMSIWVYSLYLNGLSALIQVFFVIPYGFQGLLSTDVPFWLYMIYLSLFSTVFATSLYFYTTKQMGSHKASSFTFIVPASAILLSWIFLNETPGIATLFGGCIAVFAVYLIQYKQHDVTGVIVTQDE
jgi:drug/metabolite transporter (DMT)-like permease